MVLKQQSFLFFFSSFFKLRCSWHNIRNKFLILIIARPSFLEKWSQCCLLDLGNTAIEWPRKLECSIECRFLKKYLTSLLVGNPLSMIYSILEQWIRFLKANKMIGFRTFLKVLMIKNQYFNIFQQLFSFGFISERLNLFVVFFCINFSKFLESVLFGL